ncbi:MAG: alpha-N-acetylglucosaminidase TIM-barrel domain-containing protein [Planctomycetota bacterium]
MLRDSVPGVGRGRTRRAPRVPLAVLGSIALCAFGVVVARAEAGPSSADTGATKVAQEGPGVVAAIQALAERWLGERAADVTFELSSGELAEGFDAYAVLSVDGRTRIYGESATGLARGLFEFLRTDAARMPSWWSGAAIPGDVDAQAPLPPATPSRGASPYALRVELSPEAFAYGAAFWDAARFEREVDLAALRGANAMYMPLGRDRVMAAVYERLEVPPEKAATWTVGAAFRAFGWSGQAVGWMGPMSPAFAESDVRIARRAVARMRELGVVPILPAFTGVVPLEFAQSFEGVQYYELPEWALLGRSALIDPGDPLFRRMASAYYEELAARVGESTLYFGSPLGEVRPPITAAADLAALSRGVSDALTEARPGARWLLSSWPFRFDRGFWSDERLRAYLGSVDPERLVVLDRVALADPTWDRTSGFFGHPFVWGTTPSFGGRQRLGGKLALVGEELERARASDLGLQGAAVCVEYPGVDPLRHDYLCDQLWSTATIDPDAWIEGWVRARYGRSDPRAVRAWRRILAAAYRPDSGDGGPSTVASAPSTVAPPPVPYDDAEFVLAWQDLVAVAETSTPRPALLFDIVDVGRQTLSNAAREPIVAVLDAWRAGDADGIAAASARALALMDDLDELLSTHPAFLLGAWLEAAGARASNDTERASIVAGARALVTHFGPRGSSLRDWGAREWAGLVGKFQRERWRRLFEALATSVASGAAFDAESFDRDLAQFEREWSTGTSPFPAAAMGKTRRVSRKLLDQAFELGPDPVVESDANAALVDERTPPVSRWRVETVPRSTERASSANSSSWPGCASSSRRLRPRGVARGGYLPALRRGEAVVSPTTASRRCPRRRAPVHDSRS